MKYIKHISFILTLLVASCTSDDLVQMQHETNNNNQVCIVGRPVRFSPYDVRTRATTEDDLGALDFMIFAEKSDGNKVCVLYKHSEDQSITIDRSIEFGSIANDIDLTKCHISIVSGFPGLYELIKTDAKATMGSDDEESVETYIKDYVKGQKGTDYFLGAISSVEATVGVPEGGLPRVGSYVEDDGNTAVDLSLEANLTGGQVLQVALQSLYAKMVFNISVDPIEIGTAWNANQFQLTGYKVYNVPKTIDMTGGTESNINQDIVGTTDNVEVFADPIEGILESTPVAGKECSFTFYLPERYLCPQNGNGGTRNDYFTYPFTQVDGTIRDEDLNLRQRYKPLLAQGYTSWDKSGTNNGDAKATYVTISGTYTNHQGHTFNVDYDIYVGNDNYGNFDVVRNRQYNNSVVIRGINNANGQSDNLDAISIDHRVNVESSRPIFANLRRETLLDAHFEVRPLRIRANMLDERNTPSIKNNSAVKVTVSYSDAEDAGWVGLERSSALGDDTGLYCTTDGSSKGKRKFFTYGLVSGTQLDGTDEPNNLKGTDETGVVVPVTQNNQCVWIYVDECTEASSDINAIRSATITLTYGTLVGNEFTEDTNVEPLVYTINQHKLYEVIYVDSETNESRTYYIEHEEEYLHNFDSEDTYSDNKTEEEGMVWGLYNAQLSFDHNALFFDSYTGISFIDGILNNWSGSESAAKYDFYVKKHDDGVSDQAEKHEYKGYEFCKEIIDDINGTAVHTDGDGNEIEYNTNYNGTIGNLQLEASPSSAIEYAYNRNKRNPDGSIASYNWYLPAIDEMEDIMVGGHSVFTEFQGKYYWSCQPSYMRNYAYYIQSYIIFELEYEGEYYSDDTGIYQQGDNNTKTYNTGYARATRAVHKGNEEFDFAKSGISSGHDNAYHGNDRKFYYTETYQNNALQNWDEWDPINVDKNVIQREEGNFERNTKHRVRLAYKKTATTNTVE